MLHGLPCLLQKLSLLLFLPPVWIRRQPRAGAVWPFIRAAACLSVGCKCASLAAAPSVWLTPFRVLRYEPPWLVAAPLVPSCFSFLLPGCTPVGSVSFVHLRHSPLPTGARFPTFVRAPIPAPKPWTDLGWRPFTAQMLQWPAPPAVLHDSVLSQGPAIIITRFPLVWLQQN